MSTNHDMLMEISHFFRNRGKLYSAIVSATSDNVNLLSLYKMTNHEVIVNQIFSPDVKCDRYYMLSNALSKMNEDRVLIRIGQIDLYILFDRDDRYKFLLNRIYDWVIPSDIKTSVGTGIAIEFSQYQLILTIQKQKIIFLITASDKDIEATRKYCKELFGCETILTCDKDTKQITICIDVDSFALVEAEISKLEKYIDKIDSELYDRIRIRKLREMEHDGKSYTIAMVKIGDQDKLLDIIKYLGSAPDKFIVNNITNITVNNVNNVNNSNNTLNNSNMITDIYGNDIDINQQIKKKGKGYLVSDEALKWVEDAHKNKMIDKSSTHDLYLKYRDEKVAEDKKCLREGPFGDLIILKGYHRDRRGDGTTRWYAKMDSKKTRDIMK